MFDNSPGDVRSKECTPDYEGMAARLKVRIEANKECLSGMTAGISLGSLDLNSEEKMFFYGIIGYLSIRIPREEKEYEAILKKL